MFRSGNPALKVFDNPQTIAGFDRTQSRAMTVQGTVNAAFILVSLCAAGAIGSWWYLSSGAASGLVAPVGIAVASFDQGVDLRPIEIASHHPHAFAVAPIEPAVVLIEVKLLGCEGGALRNDDPAISAVQIGALDRAVVLARNAHIGPINMTGLDIDHDAIAEAAICYDGLVVGAVGIHRLNTAGVQFKHEQSAHRDFAALGRRGIGHLQLGHGRSF